MKKVTILNICDFQVTARWPNGIPLTINYFNRQSFERRQYNESKCHTCDSQFVAKHRNALFPTKDMQRSCILMTFENLAEIEWIQIACSTKMVQGFVCVFEEPNITHSVLEKNDPGAKFCEHNYIYAYNTCNQFDWLNNENIFHAQRCQRNLIIEDKDDAFLFLLNATSLYALKFLTKIRKNYAMEILHKKFLSSFVIKSHEVSVTLAEGYFWCESVPQEPDLGINLIQLENMSFVSAYVLFEDTLHSRQKFFKQHGSHFAHKIESFVHLICKHLHVKDFRICSPWFAISSKQNVQNAEELFVCQNGAMISSSFVDDLTPDCLQAEDEPILFHMLQQGKFYHCDYNFQIPCMEGHTRCYNISQVCSYSLSKGKLAPCPNGGHLENCEQFKCTSSFKCFRSYCIKWSVVCDGKWDCPGGDDEANMLAYCKVNCTHMFRCKGDARCIHIANVCDNIKDCILDEDELFCQLHRVKCPHFCECLGFVVNCNNTENIYFNEHLPFHFVFITRSFPVEISTVVNIFTKLYTLYLVQCDLKHISAHTRSNELLKLDLSHNQISVLKEYSLMMPKLQVLLMKSNNLKSIHSNFAGYLSKLSLLSLAENSLLQISAEMFIGLKEIVFLNIRNTSNPKMHGQIFSQSVISTIITSDYHVCCIQSVQSVCTATIPWYTSCFSFFPDSFFKYVYIVIASFLFLLSSISLLLHLQKTQMSVPYVLSIGMIATNDLILGLYILFIWYVDHQIQRSQDVNWDLWSSSMGCLTLFVLILLFSLLAQIIPVCLSFLRLLVIIHPLKTSFKHTNFVSRLFASIWVLTLTCSLTVALVLKATAQKLIFPFCLPFVDPTLSVLFLWCFSLFYLLVLAASCILCINHVLILKECEKSAQKISKHQKEIETKTSAIGQQLFLLTISHILCWVTSGIVFLTAMFYQEKGTKQLIIWTLGLIIPSGSITNQILYVVTCVKKIISNTDRKS